MDGMCGPCLYEEAQRRVNRSMDSGTTDAEKNATLEFIERLTQATKVKVQLPLSLGTDVPPSQRGPDTI